MTTALQLLACLAITIMVTSCATAPRLNTASGKPEITVPGRVAEQLSNDIVNAMLTAGYSISTQSPNQLVFDRAIDSFAAKFAYGSSYDRTPNARIEYTIASLPDSTRVVATFKAVTNPGSAFERSQDLSHGPDADSIQSLLDSIAQQYSKTPNAYTSQPVPAVPSAPTPSFSATVDPPKPKAEIKPPPSLLDAERGR